MKIRIEAIDKILAVCYGELDTVMNHTKCPVSSGTDAERKVCQQLKLGGLIYGFRSMGIWPPKISSSEVRCSISDLVDNWTGSEHFTLVRSSASPSEWSNKATKPAFTFSSSTKTPKGSHAPCQSRTDIQNAIMNIMNYMPSPVQESHLLHLEKQAAK
jgi:hypothetical protein